MFTVSTIITRQFFCLCNDVIMRYRFLQSFAPENRWKTFRFSIFISQGYSWIMIIYMQKGKVWETGRRYWETEGAIGFCETLKCGYCCWIVKEKVETSWMQELIFWNGENRKWMWDKARGRDKERDITRGRERRRIVIVYFGLPLG